MSFSLFKDFDKCAKDLINDDFDTKTSLKVKSEGPSNVSLTTTTDYNPGASVLPTKVNFKWAHESGFAVDKLEIASCEKVTLETSLVGVAPGLKLEFKGVDNSSGTLGLVYKHKLATIASDLDIVGFSSTKASVLGGANGVLAGASADFDINKCDIKDYAAGIAYSPCCGVFAGLKATKKFTEFNSSIHYKVNPKLSVAAMVDYVPKKSTHGFKIGAAYKCCPETSVKVKVDNDLVVKASVKQELPKKLVVVGAAEVDVRNPGKLNFGVTATLG